MVSPSDEGLAAAVRWRSRAIASIRAGRPAAAHRALRRALRAVDPAQVDPPGGDHLRTALGLEMRLLDGIRRAHPARAAEAFESLVELHGTQHRAAAAFDELPEEVRTFGVSRMSRVASPLVFALPFRALRHYLLAALPALAACPHGRLAVDGACDRDCPRPQHLSH
jgi:hypothetical protein